MLSDLCFLIGIPFLVAGLFRWIRTSGYLFFARHGFRQFFSVLTNSKRPYDDAVAAYFSYRKKSQEDAGHKKPLAIGIFALVLSLAFALFRFQ